MSAFGGTWRALRHACICLFVSLLAACGGGADGDSAASLGRLLSDDVAAFRGNGTWWNPAEPGTGFFFEAQGGVAIVSFFVYDDEGAPVWYSAAGGFGDAGVGKYRFEGALQRFEGGPVINDGDSTRPASSTAMGTVTIAFDGSDRAQVQLPKRSFQAVKFATRAVAAPVGAVVPETGVFWDPAHSGRGFTVEVDGSSVTIGLYGFTRAGRPTWRLAVGELKAGPVTVRPTVFRDGQTLDGPYKPPVGEPAASADDDIVFQFETPCFGAISLNGSLPIERFSFNGGSCRTASTVPPAERLMLAPDLPATTAFTANQLRAMAGRALHLVEVMVGNESLATVFFGWQKDFAPGPGEGSCAAAGYAYWEKTDPDQSNSLTPGDALHLDAYDCRLQLPYPGATIDARLDGFAVTTLAQESTEGFSSRLQFYWLLRESKISALALDGAVLVRTKLDYWFSSQQFHGLSIVTFPDGQRTHLFSGVSRRHGVTGGGADVNFEPVFAALPLSVDQRVRARLRLESPTTLRVTAAGNLDYAPDQFTQGVLLIELEPNKADGVRLRLRVEGRDQLVLEHWSGSRMLSSQNVSHQMLRTAAGLQ